MLACRITGSSFDTISNVRQHGKQSSMTYLPKHAWHHMSYNMAELHSSHLEALCCLAYAGEVVSNTAAYSQLHNDIPAKTCLAAYRLQDGYTAVESS